MIVCHVCGTENPDGSKFCEGCGVELQAPVAPVVAAVAPVVEAAIPAMPAVPEIAAPALSADEAALDLEVTPPVLPAVEAPALELPALETPAVPVVEAVAPVVEAVVAPEAPIVADASPLDTVISAPPIAPIPAVLSSTLDGTVNPKATVETPVKVAKLLARGGSSEVYVLHSERMVVGRFDPSAGPVDIDLSGGQGENYISRRHSEVFLENGVWMVRDLGSTNGVYVKRAGQAQYSPRIIEPQALSDGDEVAFGNMKFLFTMSDGA